MALFGDADNADDIVVDLPSNGHSHDDHLNGDADANGNAERQSGNVQVCDECIQVLAEPFSIHSMATVTSNCWQSILLFTVTAITTSKRWQSK